MKIYEVVREAVEMCPKACCGVPVTECSCGPDCKHCDCYNKNKAMKETVTSAGSVATAAQSMNTGNMISRNMYNKDGTMKNGLDSDSVLGGPAKPKKKKRTQL